jgi:hypothetical protein
MEKKDMIPVGTKVSPEAREIGKEIFQRLGITEYDYLQMCYDMIICMKDDRHQLSYAMEQMLMLMDGMKDWHTSIRLTDSEEKFNIREAIYILREEGRTGTRSALVQGDSQDLHRTVTFNKQDIVERFICTVLPTLYRRLRLLGTDLGTNSIYETLERVVDDQQLKNTIAQEVYDEFSMDDYERGFRMSQQVKTKQTRMTQTQKEIEWS